MEKTIDGIGKVIFKKSGKAKQVNITVKPFMDVVVSVPENIDVKLAEDAVLKNINWIKREKLRMKKVESKYTTFKVGQVFEVKDLEFTIKKKGKETDVLKTNDNQFTILIPSNCKIKDLKIQQFIRDIIEEEVKKFAKVYLSDKALRLAKKNNIAITNTSIRKSKTRWGSCGNNNTLNLSYYLMFLPDYLIDYAILHELAHVKIKDHSKAYWMYLESLVKGARKLDVEIKKYGIGVY